MYSAFHRRLHAWYAQNGRHSLPWRITDDPYAIYLSEVMLQQTQVQTVLERYYFPFLERFPTLEALAAAPLQEVLKAWEGLGYYSRARNLHAAAKAAAPALPASVEGLLALPGVGRNTAHAVAAFAFRLPVPVMEANVKRVLCRIFALEHPTDKILWEKAASLLDRRNPFDYNQAMMDIGALVCTKRQPRCDACPAQAICQGKAAPQDYPSPSAKKQTPVRRRILAVFENGSGKLYLEKRTTCFLHGLYGFPEYEIGNAPPFPGRLLGSLTHTYSHFKLEAEVRLFPKEAGKTKTNGGWFTRAEIARLPLSRADHKALALVDAHIPA